MADKPVKHVTIMPDRIRVNMSFKKNPAQYESVDAGIAIESSPKKGETLGKAITRVAGLVEKEFDELQELYEKKYSG